MIRELPVDTSRINFIATGHVTPVNEWIEDGNGGRKLSGMQARDEQSGQLLWNVDAMADGEEFDRAEVIGVQVTAPYQPVVKKFASVPFKNLRVRFSRGRDGQLKNYWSATGVGDIPGMPKPVPSPGDNKPA